MRIITAKILREKFENDLKKLQDSCKHKETKWMDYMWAPGHFGLPVKVCLLCEFVVDRKEYKI